MQHKNLSLRSLIRSQDFYIQLQALSFQLVGLEKYQIAALLYVHAPYAALWSPPYQ